MPALWSAALALAALTAAAPAGADDVRGAQALLCAATRVIQSTETARCEGDGARDMSLPAFIDIDLQARRWGATVASGEKWVVEIQALERAGDLLLLQGQARGRTFSFVIHEPTGSGGFTEIGFSPLLGPQVFVVFGSCTPVPPGRL
jgi:hypothetical protein